MPGLWVRLEKVLFLCSFDVRDSVAYSCDAFSLVIGNSNAEFLFELHDELYGVEAICAEIGGECSSFSF